MPYVDVTRLVNDVDPFDLSASRAERGENAGPETWANAKANAGEAPLDLDADDRNEAKRYFKGFGAWDDEEIAGWSDEDVDALILQYAAGDLRELQALCPGDGFAGIDWDEAESLAHDGTVCGALFVSGDRLMLALVE